MIKEAYCSYEVAKLLKEKGFNDYCVKFYCNLGNTDFELRNAQQVQRASVVNNEMLDSYLPTLLVKSMGYAAPTHQMVMAWLREKKNILIYVYPVIDLPVKNDDTFYWQWDGKKKRHDAPPHIGDKHNYETFEDAVEAALKYVLENLI